MFNKKIDTATTEQCEPEMVSCETCKCLLYKSDARMVLVNGVEVYYCQAHKKPYTRIRGGAQQYDWGSVTDYTPIRYFGEVEMTEDGTPVGYKKIK